MVNTKRRKSGAPTFRFRKSDALVHHIIENATVGVALVGTNGRVIAANRLHSNLFGYELAECGGLGLGDLVEPDEQLPAGSDLGRLTRCEIDTCRAERRC